MTGSVRPLTAAEHVSEAFRILRHYEHGGMVDSAEAERAILARLATLDEVRAGYFDAATLDVLRVLSDAATPGPWRHFGEPAMDHPGFIAGAGSPDLGSVARWVGYCWESTDDDSSPDEEASLNAANADFIVAAVNAIRAALSG